MRDKLDSILRAFGDYIREHDGFDIVYSAKIGYVKLQAPRPDNEVPEVLDTPETLLDALFNEIINDVVFSPDNPQQTHDDPTLTEYEETESRRRISAILDTMEDRDKVRYLNFMDAYLEHYPKSVTYSGGDDGE